MPTQPPEKDAGRAGAPLGLACLGFDPEAILLRDPSVLFDRNFLGALHQELNEQLGAHDANLTLLQMGFLHGLLDAFDTVASAFSDSSRTPVEGESRCSPPLAMQMCTDGPGESEAALALSGTWPERREASARLESIGRAETAGCYLSAGYTSGWLSGTLDADILALESSCCACGEQACEFAAREASEWQQSGNPAAARLLEALPFDAMRNFVRCNRDAREDALHDMRGSDADRRGDRFDPNAAVVHIWGPVMVIPFDNGDEALHAVELIGHDPAARDVSVVVVDLSNAIVDEAYGALALEQIVDLIEAWGAEAIFASVSPLSEAAIADLDRQPLFVHKDLAQAIATAFQVADAQHSPS